MVSGLGSRTVSALEPAYRRRAVLPATGLSGGLGLDGQVGFVSVLLVGAGLLDAAGFESTVDMTRPATVPLLMRQRPSRPSESSAGSTSSPNWARSGGAWPPATTRPPPATSPDSTYAVP
ncbi:hypothetical protein GCM10022233_44570 [Streptomyces shaanxiensis]|uniref:Uncharacterized protein n=1 Tax=Streptomyces shaanxiensis TaxID=653357 RepID=A0ABP7VDW4_9ACTN